MNCGQVCGTSWKPHGIWHCRLHARQVFSICLGCFDLFINQTQVETHSQEADTEEFLCNRFIFFTLKTYLFCDDGIFSRKVLLMYSVCILYSAQFTGEEVLFVKFTISSTSICSYLSVCRCAFLNSLLSGIRKMSVCAPELKEEQ